MALFVSVEMLITRDLFVDFGGSIEAGHATQSQCYLDADMDERENGGGNGIVFGPRIMLSGLRPARRFGSF